MHHHLGFDEFERPGFQTLLEAAAPMRVRRPSVDDAPAVPRHHVATSDGAKSVAAAATLAWFKAVVLAAAAADVAASEDAAAAA